MNKRDSVDSFSNLFNAISSAMNSELVDLGNVQKITLFTKNIEEYFNIEVTEHSLLAGLKGVCVVHGLSESVDLALNDTAQTNRRLFSVGFAKDNNKTLISGIVNMLGISLTIN